MQCEDTRDVTLSIRIIMMIIAGTRCWKAVAGSDHRCLSASMNGYGDFGACAGRMFIPLPFHQRSAGSQKNRKQYKPVILTARRR